MTSLQLAENAAPLLPNFSASDFEETASAEELAETLGIGPRRVYELAQREILPRAKNGRFGLKAATRAYLTFLTQGDGLARKLARAGVGEGRRGATARVRLNEIQADRARLKLQHERSQIISIQTYKTQLIFHFSYIRNMLFVIPTNARTECIGKSPDEIATWLETQIRDTLVRFCEQAPECAGCLGDSGQFVHTCPELYGKARTAAPVFLESPDLW